jgi:hypothetical protein
MTRNRLLLVAAIVLALGVAGYLYLRSGRENVAIDLVKEFSTAKDRRPNPQAFSIIEAKIGGETKPAIFTKDLAGTRIIWHETIPDNAWLKVNLGLLEEAWTVQGDGVLFRVGISDGKNYEDLLSVTVNPFANPGDKRWTDVTLDLSQYAGEAVDVIFNTNSSSPGHDDRNGDLAVWGAPRIIVR